LNLNPKPTNQPTMATTDNPVSCKFCRHYKVDETLPNYPNEGQCQLRKHRVPSDWSCSVFEAARDEKPEPAKKKRAPRKTAKKTDFAAE